MEITQRTIGYVEDEGELENKKNLGSSLISLAGECVEAFDPNAAMKTLTTTIIGTGGIAAYFILSELPFGKIDSVLHAAGEVTAFAAVLNATVAMLDIFSEGNSPRVGHDQRIAAMKIAWASAMAMQLVFPFLNIPGHDKNIDLGDMAFYAVGYFAWDRASLLLANIENWVERKTLAHKDILTDASLNVDQD